MILVHKIHLHGKMIHYGTKVAFIYVRNPKSNKRYYWARDMVNLMMMIRSFLANIVCVFSYFEEALKDFVLNHRGSYQVHMIDVL
jgi:hypothetical protein